MDRIKAIEKFATELKLDFPILEKPVELEDCLINLVYENVRKKIDLAVIMVRIKADVKASEGAK